MSASVLFIFVNYIFQKSDLLDYNIEHVKIVLHINTFILF
jgi:hypothetical protein